MRRAQLIVTYEDLAAWLRLPKGCSVFAVVPQDVQDMAGDRFRIILDGSACPEHYEGAHPQLVPLGRDHNGKTFLG